MSLAELLRQTAARFDQAALSVLAQWSPECGCIYPGSLPCCKTCPCLSTFEQLIQEKLNPDAADPSISQPDCIYEQTASEDRSLSESQV